MLKYFIFLSISFFVVTPKPVRAQQTKKQTGIATASHALIERLLPGYSAQFDIEQVPADGNKDVYEIDQKNNRVVLRGNNAVSIAVALNRYLKYTCNAHFSWCGDQLKLPAKLPLPAEKIKETIDQQYRVYFNYCTISYSAAWWDWKRWQQEIDFMALNGINMPLSVVGIEGVWYNTLLKYGFSDKEIRSFLVGPDFMAWQWMTNIESHPDGMLPKSWIDSHVTLGKQIMARELELGMQPIQQGFSGYVPRLLAKKFPTAAIQFKKDWCGFPGAAQLDPVDPLFTKLGRDFFEEEKKIFGLHHFYAADPFHEGEPPQNTTDYLNKVGQSIANLMQQTDPQYTWAMQAWSIRKDIVSVVSKQKLLVLDLGGSTAKGKEYFWGFNFVVGNLHNFGGRINMHGDIGLLASNAFEKIKQQAPNAVGTGLFMEGIIQNPVYYDLAFEVGISNDTVNLNSWLPEFAHRRYGFNSTSAADAWKILWHTAYKKGTNGVENSSIICARPALNTKKSGPNAGFLIPYDSKELFHALELLLQDKSQLSASQGYRYDAVNLLRQCLTNYGQSVHKKAAAAFKEKNREAFAKYAGEFLQMLLDVDELLATRPEFRFQNWVNAAQSWATNEAEKKYYTTNASMLVTIWGPDTTQGEPQIFDYSWREWSGLIKDYYYQRWKKFYDMLGIALSEGKEYNEDKLPLVYGREKFRANDFYSKLADFELSWVKEDKKYPAEKKGDEIEVVTRLTDKYRSSLSN